MIWLTMSFCCITKAVLKASTAEAPHLFLGGSVNTVINVVADEEHTASY
jgi:hypothetical protein